jgi:hypothetical protein
MKHRSMRRWLLAGMASLVLLTGAAGARAQDEAPVNGIATASLDDPGEPERAIGVFGAALCGAEGWLLKTNPVLGMNPYVLAAGIGGCLLMLMDMTT